MQILFLFFASVAIILLVSLNSTRSDDSKILYKDREGNIITEKTPGEFWIKWLYRTKSGSFILDLIVKKKIVSLLYGSEMDKSKSVQRIKPFIEEYKIDMSQFEDEDYSNFNEFFYRKIKDGARIIDEDSSVVVSPADGKIIVFDNIDETSHYFVKGEPYSLKTHFAGNFDYKKYIGGSMLIVRLAPADYHRFHFPVSGKVSKNINVEGDYFSVSPIAVIKHLDYFFKNKRTLCEIQTEEFGDVIYSDIGATMVGSIYQTYQKDSYVKKGDEKGYFAFGGSSVVLFFEKGKISFDPILLKNSNEGFETLIVMGEKIATKKI